MKINTSFENIDRIGINLFELKPIKEIRDVYEFYKEKLSRFFDASGHPIREYFEDVACPVCARNEVQLKFTIDHFSYVTCDYCKVVYNTPRLKEGVMEKMYKSGEYTTYFDKLVVPSQQLRKNRIDVRKFKQMSSFFEAPGRVLDVGCGAGSFLRVCQEREWEVYGLDPSVRAADVAKSLYNITIHQGGFEDFKTDVSFDCITFWGLEHLNNPMAGLKKACELLNPNGLIIFESPSADSFLMKHLSSHPFSPFRYIESARHVLFFSRKSIDLICAQFGLELGLLETNGLDIQTILMREFDEDSNGKLLSIQQTIDELMLGDHYRVFLRRASS